MIEKESGLELEFNIPCTTLMADRIKNELVTEDTPIVTEAKIITMPRNNFLLTLSEILPATSPKNE